MTTRRPLVAALITLCGAAIAAGAVLPWVDASGTRPASGIYHTSFSGLRHLAYTHSATATSFAVVVATAGILVFVGGLVASRLLTGPFSVIALAAAALWIWLNARHFHPTDLRYNDLRAGAWLTLTGGLVALLATFRLRRKDKSVDTPPWDSLEELANSGQPGVRYPTRPAGATAHSTQQYARPAGPRVR